MRRAKGFSGTLTGAGVRGEGILGAVTTPTAKAIGLLLIGFSRPVGEHLGSKIFDPCATIRGATGATLRDCPVRACSLEGLLRPTAKILRSGRFPATTSLQSSVVKKQVFWKKATQADGG